jgi:hypothetical protein
MKYIGLKVINGLMVAMLMVASILPAVLTTPVQADDAWYDVNWLYRRKITIDYTKIGATLTNFPVLVKLIDGTNFTAANALATGYDIRFIGTDGATVYKYEREYHTNAVGGSSYYWVKIPSVSSVANTEFYVYYGNAAASNGADPTNVWDSNYMQVFHMSDLTTSSLNDSTANNRDGAKGVNVPLETASGQVYEAQQWTADTQYISSNYAVGTTYSVQLWFKSGVLIDSNPALWSGNHNGTYGSVEYDQCFYYLNSSNTTKAWSNYANGGVVSAATVYPLSWQYVATTVTGTTNKMYHNVDAPVTVTDYYNGSSQDTWHYLGAYGNMMHFIGTMDEVRVSNVVRAEAWIDADYYSQSNTLLSVGAENGGTLPTVSTVAASNILSSVARVNGIIDDMGDAECVVKIGYDTVTHASDFFYSTNTTIAGTYATSESFYSDLSGLTPSTPYYFNTWADNGVGIDMGTEATFTTEAAATGTSVGAPTYFVGVPTDHSLSLTWVRGTSTNATVIRYLSGNTAPTSNITGAELYRGGLTYTSLTGLSGGRTYSFIAWGLTPEGAWSTSNATLTLSTLGVASESEDTPAPSTPLDFFTDSDYTNMQNTLLYPIINLVIDGMGMDRNFAWLMLAILLSVVASIIATSITRKMFIGLVVSVIGMGFGWIVGIVPMWIPVASGIAVFALLGNSYRGGN